MTAHCRACGSKNLRPSRLQLKDLVYLIILRYPVRCRTCRERFSFSIFSVRKIQRDAQARRALKANERRMPHAVDLEQHGFDDLR